MGTFKKSPWSVSHPVDVFVDPFSRVVTPPLPSHPPPPTPPLLPLGPRSGLPEVQPGASVGDDGLLRMLRHVQVRQVGG